MIVDDERDIRDLVKIVLEKNKYAVITATDGDDCLGKLKTAKPNLILMDMRMPGTPVKEVTRRIKGTKIVYLSGMSSQTLTPAPDKSKPPLELPAKAIRHRRAAENGQSKIG